MPSRKRITDYQIRLYMQAKNEKWTRVAAAARAGFSERSARRIEKNGFQPAKTKHDWRTRPDPFESVWANEVVPLLEAHPNLRPRTLLEELQRRHEGKYPDKLLRTLQRRARLWKATSGPSKEIIFRQKHLPGWQGISDFTDMNKLGVSIRGELLEHKLYHYRLSFSGWKYAQVVLGGESFTALSEGLQNAFWSSGGIPETHRTDSLSAVYKNCANKEKEDFTQSYQELCTHYGVEPTRNNKGISHENGSIESPHRHLKEYIDQALLLRGVRNFDSIDEYKTFIRELIGRQNNRIAKEFAEECAFLKPLPERKSVDYSEERVRVTSSSTITVKSVTYSVPSRLIGMQMKVLVYDDRLECYVGGDFTVTLKRLRKHKKRIHCIDYRHVVESLAQKPQAFRNYIYQDDLFPTFAFRQTWELLDKKLDDREACREFVKILREAARPEREKKVSDYLEECLAKAEVPTSIAVKGLFPRPENSVPTLKEAVCELADYDVLLCSLKRRAV
jgi:hypothetical protein